MRRAMRHAFVVAAAAAMLVGGGGAVQADPGTVPEIPEAGYTESCQDIGGGTWCTGTASGSNPFREICYSNYFHPTNRHSSTAMMADGTDRAVAEAGQWSYASVEAGAGHTCYTRYNPDA
ncbi:hypothetical protein GCM10009830_48660 [Glycomyces endophyticus]|uniref:Lactococcin 972 family bacteriocin n=1 Tax=Glycomyces endophyticus TaxID=480996 RepID=A0ABP4TWW1_9ACTN